MKQSIYKKKRLTYSQIGKGADIRYNKKGSHLYQTNTLYNVNYVSGIEMYTLSVMRSCLGCQFSEK